MCKNPQGELGDNLSCETLSSSPYKEKRNYIKYK